MSHLHPHRSDDDQIFQKYLDRAIEEINQLAVEMEACDLCDHGGPVAPVVGTGHPLADIFLLKYLPRQSEIDEGVAFFGPAGDAVLKSVRRLNIDPLDIYGTNCVKCSATPTACMTEHCPTWLRREVNIVGPKLLVVMGQSSLDAVNSLGYEDASHLAMQPGTVQRWTHTCEAVTCPDIDDSLVAPQAKRDFWNAFRAVGDWYADRPPY